VPTGLSATPFNVQVVLSWTAPASNGGSPITGYRIYRGTTAGTETLLATVAVVTSFTDTAVTNGTTYFYQVAARNSVGDGARSAEVSARPATVPGVPRNVTATRSATLGVNLSWAAPLSNGGAAVTGYRIYRSTTTGTEVFLVAVGNVTSYIDKATSPGVRYFYKITAVNSVGEGARSAEVNARAR
jgi:titin